MTPDLATPLSSPRRSFLRPVVFALLFALGAVAALTLFGVVDLADHPFERQRFGGFRR